MIELREETFNPWQELLRHEESFHNEKGKYGANAVFVGTMRDFNEASNIESMFLEHYPEMTSRYLEKIVAETKNRWAILDVMLLHRVGNLVPDDSIVLIAVWSAHRNEAFEACRYIIEELKHRAPFWKKETRDDKTGHWVTNNTPKNKSF
ncbi:molybdenum cofactor biosynthesis protein MoaE [Kaarinaea lacus]